METYAVALRTSCTRAYLCRPVELVGIHLGRHSTSSEKPPGPIHTDHGCCAAHQIKPRNLPSLSNFFVENHVRVKYLNFMSLGAKIDTS
jgi:hypothetical protein